MPIHRLILCGFVIAAVIASRAMSQQDPPKKDIPFRGPPPPEELQVLAHRIGNWTSKWEVRPSLQHKEGYTATGQATGQWFQNRHFIRMEGKSAGSEYLEESSIIYGYDVKKKVYRRWMFSSSGVAGEAEGQWDEAKRTMIWKPLNLAPDVTGSITEVHDEDRVETTVHFKRKDGQVLTDITMISTREQ